MNGVDDFLKGLSSEARAIAWVTYPDGHETKYLEPDLRSPLEESDER
jgi:hypothetical protein